MKDNRYYAKFHKGDHLPLAIDESEEQTEEHDQYVKKVVIGLFWGQKFVDFHYFDQVVVGDQVQEIRRTTAGPVTVLYGYLEEDPEKQIRAYHPDLLEKM